MEDASEPVEREHAETEFEIELADLEPEDNTHGATGFFSRAFLNWQRSVKRRHLRVGIAVCIVALVGAVALANLGSYLSALPGQPEAAQSLVNPQQSLPSLNVALGQEDGLACITDNAWSPDSRYFAVLGSEGSCSRYVHEPGLLNVYDVRSTGKALEHLHLDYLILQTLDNRPLSRDRSGLSIEYMHVLWSPDGKRLAVTFVDTEQPSLFYGLLLMDMSGKHVQVLLQPRTASARFDDEWDVVRGVPVRLPPPAPALIYRWGGQGHLIAQAPLSSKAMPPAPPPGLVGSPDGGQWFTVWQPGLANPISLSNGLIVFRFSTSFAAWSPDGRYIVEGLGLQGEVAQHGETTPFPAVSSFQTSVSPLLSAASDTLTKSVSIMTAVAWNPDGRILATYAPGKLLTLYDAASGRKLLSLPPPARQVFLQGSVGILRWSPDGSSLLLSGQQWGAVALWNLGTSSKAYCLHNSPAC
ncbi:MAG TPA: WD40 repeat domain-containing protein [Ktedonobacteraceae bacterium]|nr:WD40 repeat domain-containing protein [Ktedonobacteraceae bacterium]